MSHIAATRILLALLLGAIAAAANVLGGLAIVRRQWSRAYLKYFIALGAGFMLATAFLEMIPESLKLASRTDEVFFLVLGGYLLIHFFEHTVAPHFHFGEETHSEELAPAHAGIAAVLGLVIHTFFDGVAIASGVLVSTWLGGVIFLAVFLHKLPEGSTVASLTLASGQSRRVALLSSVVLGGATIVGVGLMYVLRGAVGLALPFAAGVTIYVAASDLVPEVNREPAVGLPVLVFLGVLAMLLLKLTFHL
jgi:ZIP family zinc transporter/zinc and cadmium transporter